MLRLSAVACIVVMPSNSPKIKKAAVAGYGARIVECAPTQQAREAMVKEILAEHPHNSVFVPPYDHVDVMAGQGTIALEMHDQIDRLQSIVVPVGGGGMLSGMAVASKGVSPRVKVFAAEPLNASDCAQSKRSGERIPLPPGEIKTVADGLKTSLGTLTWPIIRDHVEDVFTVTEAEIIAAMRLVYERMKLVIEPSAAVGLAAVLSDGFRQRVPSSVQRVGVVLCGGNVDLDGNLPWASK